MCPFRIKNEEAFVADPHCLVERHVLFLFEEIEKELFELEKENPLKDV